MALEIIGGWRYSNRVDVFSFGVLLYETVARKQPCQIAENSPNPVAELCAKVMACRRIGSRFSAPLPRKLSNNFFNRCHNYSLKI
jgi:serine/threonine protein kinase